MSSAPTIDELVDALRRFVAAGNPRLYPTELHVTLSDGRSLDLPLDLFPAGTSAPSATFHSDDFSSVVWFGSPYTFTTAQRQVVERLWACWEEGMPGVAGETLTEGAGSGKTRLRDLFRDNSAWGTMIQAVRRGVYALAEPRG